MKRAITFTLFVTGCLTALPGTAQMEHGMGMGMGMGMGGGMGPGMMGGEHAVRAGRPAGTCAVAPDPKQCEARRAERRARHQEALGQCKETSGREHRLCMRDVMAGKQDCSGAADQKRCEAMKTAYEGCREKTGPAFRQCMRAQVPARKPAAAVPTPAPASKP